MRGTARDVGPSAGFRFVCYCHDCQTFARFLDRPDILDEAGGTDIFQLPPRKVELTTGADAVRAVRFSRSVIRWYAGCCRTPIANTAGSKFPMVALIHTFMSDHQSADGGRDEALGPPICRIYGGSATGPLPPYAPPPASFSIRVWRLATILGWWLRGWARPTPFFDEATGAPISVPVPTPRRSREL